MTKMLYTLKRLKINTDFIDKTLVFSFFRKYYIYIYRLINLSASSSGSSYIKLVAVFYSL